MRGIPSTNRPRLAVVAALALAFAATFGALGYASPDQTSAQAQYAPRNTSPPTISDTTPEVGQRLRANEGTWRGDRPITFTFQWLRCSSSGRSCTEINGANGGGYTVKNEDLGRTLRVRVTARNSSGRRSAESAATSPVTAPQPPGPSVPVTAVVPPNRLIAAEVRFDPNPIRSRLAQIVVRVKVVDTRGLLVTGALVFVRSTPLVTTSSGEAVTGGDGWAQIVLTPREIFRVIFRPGWNLQIFVRARKPGDNLLAGVSGRRLVQVRLTP